ncbi:hypothetical protein Bbelb_277610 [Branchiostoma belcheri]|nr:hypothetical protein Bbelb_277610 [Branchiostoma belcheri]
MLSGVSALVTRCVGCITTASLVSLLCVTKTQTAVPATPTCHRLGLPEVIWRGLTTQTTSTSPMDKLRDAKEACLWGLLIGDALSMPVHWYYDADDIKRDYGKWLTGYVAPKKHHPSSIMSLSATATGQYTPCTTWYHPSLQYHVPLSYRSVHPLYNMVSPIPPVSCPSQQQYHVPLSYRSVHPLYNMVSPIPPVSCPSQLQVSTPLVQHGITHPSSIMSLSATGRTPLIQNGITPPLQYCGSGRSGFSMQKEEPLIGNVILHDKLQYWTKSAGASVHYHQGMSAGDNTLNALCALRVCQTMARVDPDGDLSPRDLRSAVLADYVTFLTTPGSHNDTYAESFHRAFFRDWIPAGKPVGKDELIKFAEKRYKEQSAGRADSQLAVIGAFVMAVPFVLHSAHLPEAETVRNTVDFVRLTHPLPPSQLEPYVELYAKSLHAVLNGASLQEKSAEALQSPLLGGTGTWKRVQAFSSEATGYAKGSDMRLSVYQEAVGHFGLACYIRGSLTSLFFLAHEFHDDMEGGVLTNTNVGGENCHRGAALGALLAAAAGRTGTPLPQGLKDGLGSAQNDLMALLANSKL